MTAPGAADQPGAGEKTGTEECGRVHRIGPNTGWASGEEMLNGGRTSCGCGSAFFHHRAPGRWSCVRCGQPAPSAGQDERALTEEQARFYNAGYQDGIESGAPSAGQDTGRLRDELVEFLLVFTGRHDNPSASDRQWIGNEVNALLDGPLRQLIDQRDQARRAETLLRETLALVRAERDSLLDTP